MREMIIALTLAATLVGAFFIMNQTGLFDSSTSVIKTETVNQSTAAIAEQSSPAGKVLHKTIQIDGLDIFYREAGSKDAPTILLLHGFPTSSHMFRDLIPELADEFHLIAPDFPGYGNSAMPLVDDYDYTFDNLSIVVEKLLDQLNIDRYSIYLMDYGAPVGYRIAERNPEKVEALIVQNGNAYVEGLREFWDPIRAYWNDPSQENGDQLRGFFTLDTTIWQFTNGVRNVDVINPDSWIVPQFGLDRPGNQEIQLALFYDYRTNVPLYPAWQEYFRTYQPPTLIVWGQNDVIFPAEGAYPYLDDLNNVEFHLLDTGHFALEEDGQLIADYIRTFLKREL